VKELLSVIASETKQSRKCNNNATYIIGKKPDLESLRNFVSLDTRSREIRNKIKDER